MTVRNRDRFNRHHERDGYCPVFGHRTARVGFSERGAGTRPRRGLGAIVGRKRRLFQAEHSNEKQREQLRTTRRFSKQEKGKGLLSLPFPIHSGRHRRPHKGFGDSIVDFGRLHPVSKARKGGWLPSGKNGVVAGKSTTSRMKEGMAIPIRLDRYYFLDTGSRSDRDLLPFILQGGLYEVQEEK